MCVCVCVCVCLHARAHTHIHKYVRMYIYMCVCVYGVMITIVGNRHGNPISNLDETVCTFANGMQPTILPPKMDK